MITQYFHLGEEELFETFQDLYERQFWAELERQFPTAPFGICFLDSLGELDEKFSDEPFIMIYDDRGNRHDWTEEEIPLAERRNHRKKTMVFPSNKTFTTLRDVLNAMIADKPYHHEVVKEDSMQFFTRF